MQRWTAFLLSGALTIAFVIGLFIQPLDSQANNPVSLWQADFFNNAHLAGKPVLSRHDRDINFNWSKQAPDTALPIDQFSARWTGNFNFEAGHWAFSAGADDGIRVWVDDTLLIDQWSPSGTFTIYSQNIYLNHGKHIIKVEYYDAEGLAGISINWKPVPDAPTNANTVASDPPNQPAQEGAKDKPPLAHVATGVLNVRVGPGVQFERIDQIFLYQRYPLLAQNPDGSWYLIDLKDGRSGWVASQFIFRTGSDTIPTIDIVAPEPPSPGVPGTFQGTEALPLARLNLRPEPSTDNDPITIIPYEATTMIVLGRDSTSIWYYVQYEGLEGWVFAPLVDLDGFKVYDLPFIQA